MSRLCLKASRLVAHMHSVAIRKGAAAWLVEASTDETTVRCHGTFACPFAYLLACALSLLRCQLLLTKLLLLLFSDLVGRARLQGLLEWDC